jgi:hypothetical protein
MSTAVQGRACDYCPETTTGPLRGERGGKRAAQDHPRCYDRLLADLAAAETAMRTARVEARVKALRTGVLHLDDQTLIDAQAWTPPGACDECHDTAPTVLLGNTTRWCRACVGVYLTLTRAQAEDHGRGRPHTPALPGSHHDH